MKTSSLTYTEKIMKEPGWTMAGVFADEGITGTSTCKRKEFLRMIRQYRQGKNDMILAKSVSRFARNTVDTLNFTRELRSLGIPVVFEEQNINSIYPESEFLITLHGAFAQAESESTSSRARWGKRQAMKSGHVAMQYKQLLGYEKGSDGKPRIVPEQAETVRFIYDRYLAGDSIREIKAALEGQGIPTVSGKAEWMASHIRSILTNEKYCGDVLLQKTFIQDCISKKVIPNTGQLPQYLIQNHHEGIVSRETFDAVQLEMARRNAKAGDMRKSTPTGRGKYSGKHVLSNLLFCGECGTRPTGGACGLSAESSAPYGGASAAWTMGRSSAPSLPPWTRNRSSRPSWPPSMPSCWIATPWPGSSPPSWSGSLLRCWVRV